MFRGKGTDGFRGRFSGRSLAFVLVSLCGFQLIACSYSAHFVIVNDSENPIEVRYKVKVRRTAMLPDIPATVAASQLDPHGGQPWQLLALDQYQFDRESGTASINLAPHVALRVVSASLPTGSEEPLSGEAFYLEEISLTGSQGQLTLKGVQARTGFVKESKVLYTLRYK